MKCKACKEKISLVDWLAFIGYCNDCDNTRDLIIEEKRDKEDAEARAEIIKKANSRRKYFDDEGNIKR